MKLNRKHIIMAVILLGVGSIMLTGFSIHNIKQNELNNMKDGLENPVINEFYLLDQQEVESVSDVQMILKYVDVDLNNDGLEDKIVIIRSPIHSGSQGDMFEILLNNKGTYKKIYTGIFRLYSQEWDAVGSVIILKNVNNGLKNIKVETDGEAIIIRYDGNSYQ